MIPNLKTFVRRLEERGELLRVRTPVDPELEIADRVSKGPARDNKALLFENVKGSAMPVLINAFESAHRMALALGVDELEELNRKLAAARSASTPRPKGRPTGTSAEIKALVDQRWAKYGLSEEL